MFAFNIKITALHLAVKNNNIEIIKLLLSIKDIDITIKDDKIQTIFL